MPERPEIDWYTSESDCGHTAEEGCPLPLLVGAVNALDHAHLGSLVDGILEAIGLAGVSGAPQHEAAVRVVNLLLTGGLEGGPVVAIGPPPDNPV